LIGGIRCETREVLLATTILSTDGEKGKKWNE
jgi:hypothetical protein